VKSALIDMLGSALEHPNIIPNLILFNNTAFTVEFDETNYLRKVEEIRASGGTEFTKAFRHLGSEMRRVKLQTGKDLMFKDLTSVRLYCNFMQIACCTL
jgi:hypothetical protein